MGDVEFAECDYCGKKAILKRKYFHYNIKCECCSPTHFEMRRYCDDCFPVEPEFTTIKLMTKQLTHIDGTNKI